MNFRVPKDIVLNSKGNINDTAFIVAIMILNCLNKTNVDEIEIEIELEYFRRLCNIKDNRTLKKGLNNLVELGVMEDYKLTTKGKLVIRQLNSSNEVVDLNIDNIHDYPKKVVRIAFYLKYYIDLQNKFPNEYFFSYVESKNISKVLNIKEDYVNEITNKLSQINELKHLTERSNFIVDERYRITLKGKRLKKAVKTSADEKILENYLVDNLPLIEEYLSFVDQQYPIKHGIIDILALDMNGNYVVIEVKITDNDKRLPYQCYYYPSEFDENTRMIVVAPGYREDILIALQKSKAELFTYEIKENEYIIKKFEYMKGEI